MLVSDRCSSLLPYTTLFRSIRAIAAGRLRVSKTGQSLMDCPTASVGCCPMPSFRRAFQNGKRDESLAWGNTLLMRSEEHTSELQSRPHLVCRLLLEKKKNRH